MKKLLLISLLCVSTNQTIHAMDWIPTATKAVAASTVKITGVAIGILVSALCIRQAVKAWQKRQAAHDCFATLKARTIDPAKTVILWDLHGVFSHPDWKTILSTAVRNPANVWHALSHRETYRTFMQLRKEQKMCFEHFFAELTRRVPELTDSALHAQALVSAQKADSDMAALFKRAKTGGAHAHILFTNNGPVAQEKLRTKSGYEFLGQYDHIFTCSPDDAFIAKPHPGYFTRVMNHVKKTYPNAQTVILIDDKPKNIYAAKDHGIDGLVFRSCKQLEGELAELGLLHTKTE